MQRSIISLSIDLSAYSKHFLLDANSANSSPPYYSLPIYPLLTQVCFAVLKDALQYEDQVILAELLGRYKKQKHPGREAK